MQRAVADEGYTEATPIQLQAIPLVLQGGDLLAAAQTGTGKTAGFTLPLLQRLAGPVGSIPRALILTPTRELAAQVEESVRTYGKHLKLRSVVVYGGVGFDPQAKALKKGIDILVATPGRLLDHVQQRTVDLSGVEVLVLDEADRMLDLGFIRDIQRILALLPKQRQNLLFSATFTPEIRELAGSFLHNPATIEVVSKNGPTELVAQVVHPVDQGRKRELLAHLISEGNWKQVLVFTRTKHGANRLAEQLTKGGIAAEAIHGNKSQSRRTRSLGDFKRGELRVLVATDIAARGLDIDQLPHVVNFDLPHVPEDYVHRIGRTGRAGTPGEAVSLVGAEEGSLMAGIERLMKRRVERRIIVGFEPGSPGVPSELDDEQPRPRQPRGRPGNGRARSDGVGGRPVAPVGRSSNRAGGPGARAGSPGNRTSDHGSRSDSFGNRGGGPGNRAAGPGGRNSEPGNRNGAPGNRTGAPGNGTGGPGNRAGGPGNRAGGPGNRAAAPGGRPSAAGNRPGANSSRFAPDNNRPPRSGSRPAPSARRPGGPGQPPFHQTLQPDIERSGNMLRNDDLADIPDDIGNRAPPADTRPAQGLGQGQGRPSNRGQGGAQSGARSTTSRSTSGRSTPGRSGWSGGGGSHGGNGRGR